MESNEPEQQAQDPDIVPADDESAAAPVEAAPGTEPDQQASAQLPPDPMVAREETRFRRSVRLGLRWGAGILLLYALGVLTATLVFYLPKVRELRSVSGDLEALTEQARQLEADISAREDQLAALQAEFGQSQTDQANAQIQIFILSAQLDIAQARLSLEREEPDSALIALNQTPATLDDLAGLVGSDQRAAIDSMQQRLELAIAGLEDDPEAARSDLEVLANNLLKLEDAFALENS